MILLGIAAILAALAYGAHVGFPYLLYFTQEAQDEDGDYQMVDAVSHQRMGFVDFEEEYEDYERNPVRHRLHR